MHNFKKKITPLVSLLLVVSFFLLSLLPTPITHAAPFTCEVSFYQIISGDLKQLDPLTGTYATLPNNITLAANALGYNTEDHYIYGLGATPETLGHLIRFEDDGSRTDLGLPTGLPADTYVAGDFDATGNLWVKSFGGNATLYSIDVSTQTATSLTTSTSLAISEMVYINGHLYSNNGGTIMHKIDPITGVVTNATIANGISGNYGAGWATVDDSLYFSENGSGMIYRIDGYSGNAPSAVPVLQGETAIQNDGAACPSATTPIIEISATNDIATTPTGQQLVVSAENGVLSNDVPDDVAIISYTQPENGIVTLDLDGSYAYTPTPGFSGQDTFTYTIEDELGNTATATVTITVTAIDEEPEAPGATVPIPGPPNSGGRITIHHAVITTTGAILVAGLLLRRHWIRKPSRI